MYYRLGLVLPVLFLAAGCAAIDKAPYPRDWPASVRKGASCQSLSGLYENRAAEYTFDDPQKDQLLAHTLLPGSGDVGPIGTVLLAYGPDEIVRVAGYSADGRPLAEKRYRRGDGIFTCDNGRLVFRLDRMEEQGGAPDDPLIGVVRSEATLAKASDGSLVMKVSSSATGLAYLLVPVHVETQHWYRFEPVMTKGTN